MTALDHREVAPCPPAGSSRTAWPYFDSQPYLERWWNEHSWSCWHLVIEFYRRELSIALPPYGVDVYPELDVSAAFATAKATPAWEEVAEERFGDVVTFRHQQGFDVHVGVIVAPLSMLHVRRIANTEITRYDSRAWRPRLTGIYRWTR